MPFEIKVIAEPGSATECGLCPLLKNQECVGFRRVPERDHSIAAVIGIQGAYKLRRLPECVEAEQKAHQRSQEAEAAAWNKGEWK